MKQQKSTDMTILPQLDKACGIDIHKDKIVCFIANKDGSGQELKEFGTFTCELQKAKAWLKANEVEHCLMESTGIYWMSLYSILTDCGISVIVANPTHIKQIPKRKTDRKDARWLCMLLMHGLVRPSFMPTSEQRVLRDYCRSRLFYSRQQNKIQNRLWKILESNNIKLRSVISSICTKTAMSIIRLLSLGITDKEQLANCSLGRARNKRDNMLLALEGTLAEHHQTQLQMLLQDFDHIQQQIKTLNTLIDENIAKHYSVAFECLDTITGIAQRSAEIILSEAGSDMSRFPTADHFTAWCGLAPGNNESAGRQGSTSIKKGNSYLKTAVVSAAWAAVRVKNSYWHALFERMRKRMKSQKAIIAIARRMLKVVYNTIQTLTHYKEKGVAYYHDMQEKAAAFRQAGKLWPSTQQ
ncbi:IS110 family transposase [Mucilaginibacter lacusdianchii]|uniref:IS110 family transposase n=1 Tax=Mucilaginibacter lacusdianchii TaxID=2684211 RepID=UPI00131D51DA|nr:IS110 family transposase [Mucilaginibacter sp. JXJ CY 39]